MTTGSGGGAGRRPSVTLQFHPDWPFRGRLVIESMAADRVYRSQFSTGSSNGGLTAHVGGDRWRWESRLFAGRYDQADPEHRPVYGAWNRHSDPYGGACRFGSAYLQLQEEVIDRCTFCFPDSVFEPVDVGGPALLPRLCALADATDQDPLDDYVEAHVHEGVRFPDDVAAVVLDPSHADTRVEAAAEQLGCPVRFHPGFTVTTGTLDPSYRGPEYVALAQSLGEVLTPAVLGVAARSGEHDPHALKRVWHYLARFGRCQDAA